MGTSRVKPPVWGELLEGRRGKEGDPSSLHTNNPLCHFWGTQLSCCCCTGGCCPVAHQTWIEAAHPCIPARPVLTASPPHPGDAPGEVMLRTKGWCGSASTRITKSPPQNLNSREKLQYGARLSQTTSAEGALSGERREMELGVEMEHGASTAPWARKVWGGHKSILGGNK